MRCEAVGATPGGIGVRSAPLVRKDEHACNPHVLNHVPCRYDGSERTRTIGCCMGEKKQQQKQEKQEKAYRQELMKGLLPINLGALFMPPIWGPANGIWITILYYPLWLFADNLFYEAFSNPTPLSVVFSIVVGVVLAAVTIIFARVSQGYACERAIKMGRTKEWYIKRQRIWAVAMGILAAVMIAAATYYNFEIRPFMPAAEF